MNLANFERNNWSRENKRPKRRRRGEGAAASTGGQETENEEKQIRRKEQAATSAGENREERGRPGAVLEAVTSLLTSFGETKQTKESAITSSFVFFSW